MGNLCEKLITGAITADCQNPIFGGVGSEAVIINYTDVEKITYDTTNGNIIKLIKLKDDAKGYIVQQLGNEPFSGSNNEMVTSTYSNKWNKTVNFAVLDNGPDVASNVIDNLCNGRFIIILVNDYRHANGDNKYEVFGAAKGLKAASITRELYGDNDSAWVCSFTEESSPKSAIFLFDTDEETTDELFNGLID